ncbi:MAG: aminodeoxychorismate synthase component I [Akkermansiaceae bacterium]
MTTGDGQPSTPQRIELGLNPVDVAAGLSHLEGMVFFDTAGNLPSRSHAPVSIIAARPVEVITGNIRDVSPLREALAEWSSPAGGMGFPNGALCGGVDYEGAFCFGVYPEMLIYEHGSGQWWQRGELADEISTPENEAVQVGAFIASMSQETYVQGVEQVHEYIRSGDIYQVNLTQHFSAEVRGGSLFPLYLNLRKASPSPLAVWMDLPDRQVLSSSPEMFLRMSGRQVETRPIKGTRPRYQDKIKDAEAVRDLLGSEKERAELIMITDLERNDLGQVCEIGSVKVEEMLAHEKLEQVHHLVSTVTGILRPDIDHLEALVACFPGGSITGAPKVRAMEIIRELESVPRGLYTGAVGYFGFNGESQFNIPIRTLVREKNQLSYHVGAGIVIDSDPAAEYQETLDKAKGIQLAIDKFRLPPSS